MSERDWVQGQIYIYSSKDRTYYVQNISSLDPELSVK